MDPATADQAQIADIKRAIHSASHETLMSTLEAVCTADPIVRQKLAKVLLVDEEQVPIQSSDEVSSDEEAGGEKSARSEKANGHEQAAGSKRSMPRYALCENCEEEFDVTENEKTSCVYHPDGSYPDDDFFADHDEDIHGIIDAPETRKEYPEGFIYECCGKNGEEPCTTGWHRGSEPVKRNRRS